jgi:predicted Zn-dependent peptidase
MKKFILYTFLIAFLASTATAQKTFKLPAYQKFKLKNGLTVYLMEQHEVPLINVSVLIPAGAVSDGKQYGLATMTAKALMHGTRTLSKQALEEQVDFVGADISTSSGLEFSRLTAIFATKDREKILNLARDILLTPSFNPEEFGKEQKNTLVNLEQNKQQPRSMIGQFFNVHYYGDHVYSNPPSGTVGSVSKLTVADAKAFYDKYYHPEFAAIAVVGDFKSSEMKALLTSLFSGWAKGAVKPVKADAEVRSSGSANVLLVNKEDAKETTFSIGGKGVPRSHPDYVSISVLNTILGGRFTSLLNDELRVNTGLTYGANSSFRASKYNGTFVISTFTASKTTSAAVDKALEVYRKFLNTGITEDVLQSGKSYVNGQFPPDYETSGDLANLLTDMFWFEFDEKFINNFQAGVSGLTLERAKQLINTHFPKNDLKFVLIGNAGEIRDLAKKYGTVKEVPIKQDVK